MNKKINKVQQYEEILKNLRKRGGQLLPQFYIRPGYRKERCFSLHLAFLQQNRVPVAYFNILAPHKGTPLYERMRTENRIIDIQHMGRWPGAFCYIQPKHYSPEEVEEKVK